MVLCCICGVQVTGTSHGGRCTQCLQKEVDITEGISRHSIVYQCGSCGKWQRPGGGGTVYVPAERESRELLAICLKSIKGISKERSLVDAGFIWTEPHSKELKVKVTLQKEVMAGIVVQQVMTCELRVNGLQCSVCKKSFTRHTWESSVQVRQRGDNHRTLLNLEQLVLKHQAHTQLIKVAGTKEGMDFFFTKERDAQAFVSFVKGVAVVRHHESKHLVSTNIHNNTQRFKRTTCIEICPVGRDDLVFLPPPLARALGGLPPYMLCNRAASFVGLLDPFSGRTFEVTAVDFFKRPFSSSFSHPQLTEFVVLDVVPLDFERRVGGPKTVQLFDIEVARVSDFGKNEDRMVVRSHLGFLQPSDLAVGYDLRTLNTGLDEEEWAGVPMEVYLVRKHRPDKSSQKRNKRPGVGAAPRKGKTKEADRRVAEDAEEEDEAAKNGLAPVPEGAGAAEEEDEGEEDEVDEEDEELQAAAEQMLNALGASGAHGDESDDLEGDAGCEDAPDAADDDGDTACRAEGSAAGPAGAVAEADGSDREADSGNAKSGRGRRRAGRGGGVAGYPDGPSAPPAEEPDERKTRKGGRGAKKR
mmetsp:Transcript_95694/g.274816  ORF Transcript_95694/g.274816 Transcript_95694/m.274816 type:complete len:585 (+) Transcript_95694:80-1834(+)